METRCCIVSRLGSCWNPAGCAHVSECVRQPLHQDRPRCNGQDSNTCQAEQLEEGSASQRAPGSSKLSGDYCTQGKPTTDPGILSGCGLQIPRNKPALATREPWRRTPICRRDLTGAPDLLANFAEASKHFLLAMAAPTAHGEPSTPGPHSRQRAACSRRFRMSGLAVTWRPRAEILALGLHSKLHSASVEPLRTA